MGDSIRELFVSIGLSGDAAEKMEHLDEKIGELGEHVKEFGETLLAAFAIEKIFEFTEHQAELGAQVLHTAERLGVETDELQKLGYAAEQSGGSMEGMGVALRFLSRNMEQAKKGGELGALFKKNGIEVKNADGSMRSATEVMGDLADAIQKLPPGAERVALAMKVMGRGGASMIPVLSKGRQGLADMAKEAQDLGGVMSEEYLESAHKAEQGSLKLSYAWKGMKQAIAMELFPSFTSLTEGMAKHVAGLHDLIKNTTFVRAALIGIAALASLKVVPAFLSLAKSIAGVSAEAGFMETAMGLGVFLLIAAGVVLLVLAFDDLWGTLEGKDSVISTLIDHFLGVGETKYLVDDLTAAWDELGDSIGSLGVDLPGIGEVFKYILGGIAVQLDTVFRFVTAIIKTLTLMTQVGGRAFVALKAMMSGGIDKTADADIKGLMEMGGKGIYETLTRPNANQQAFHMDDAEHKANVARSERDRKAYEDRKSRGGAGASHHITVNQYGVKDPRAEAADGVRSALDDKENSDAFSSFGIPESQAE